VSSTELLVDKINQKSVLALIITLKMIKVIQLILIMLVGIDVCVWMVFVWEETGVLS